MDQELEQQPGLAESGMTPRQSQPRGRATWLAAGLVALGIAAAGWMGVASFTHPGPHVGISTTTGEGRPYGGQAAFLASDSQLTSQQWQERADSFRQFAGKGPVQLDRLPQAAALDYINKAGLAPAQKSQLLQDVEQGKVEMVALGFYDDCAEDGDIVRVQAAGLDVTVSLLHRVQYVEIPVPKGQAVAVTILGTRDGTGGITLGMVTPQGDVHMPRLQPGEQVSFQAR